MFAMEHYGVEADLVLLGKPLGNGLPMSACVGREDLHETAERNLLPSQGQVIFWDVRRHYQQLIIQKRTIFAGMPKLSASPYWKVLKGLMDKYDIIGDVRGKGLLIGVQLVKSRSGKEPANEEIVKVNHIAYEKGLLTAYDGLRGNVFRIMPSLAINLDEAKLAVEIFDESFSRFYRTS